MIDKAHILLLMLKNINFEEWYTYFTVIQFKHSLNNQLDYKYLYSAPQEFGKVSAIHSPYVYL